MSELEAAVELATADMSTFSPNLFGHNRAETPSGPNAWVTFEATVRSAASTALGKLRAEGGPPCTELLRLCEFEEQTRCQAFQAAMMGEVGPAVYQATARSIVEKLLGKLETYAPEPSLYQAAAQCLSEYMSALNHHCDICAVPQVRSSRHRVGISSSPLLLGSTHLLHLSCPPPLLSSGLARAARHRRGHLRGRRLLRLPLRAR